jgi:hypothetical protein
MSDGSATAGPLCHCGTSTTHIHGWLTCCGIGGTGNPGIIHADDKANPAGDNHHG